MLNLRLSGICAGTAFIISLLIGLFSRAPLSVLMLRALAFAALFFVLSALARMLIIRFLPEMMEEEGLSDRVIHRPGSRINITEGDDFYNGAAPSYKAGNAPPSGAPAASQDYSKAAVPAAQADDSDDTLGNISDLLGKSGITQAAVPGAGFGAGFGAGAGAGMDQNRESGYTERGGGASSKGNSQGTSHKRPAGVEDFDTPSTVDMLPDLDSMAGVFSQASGHAELEAVDHPVSAPIGRAQPKSGAPEWSGDFNPRDLAAGLRTVLSKEKEG